MTCIHFLYSLLHKCGLFKYQNIFEFIIYIISSCMYNNIHKEQQAWLKIILNQIYIARRTKYNFYSLFNQTIENQYI